MIPIEKLQLGVAIGLIFSAAVALFIFWDISRERKR